MWHYRPWKPIVDGKFLPKENTPKSDNEQDQQLTAFLPNHPNNLMQNGEFNKVLMYIILQYALTSTITKDHYDS